MSNFSGRVLAAACVLLAPAAAGAADKPNVVLVVADDLGWADVGFHGNAAAKTPHLDKLAADGVELRRHYVLPVCSPTRTALLTGRFPSRFGVTNPQNERALPFDTVTLAAALKSVGYDTAITGKWHLGSKPEWGPNKFGFARSYGSLAGGCGPLDHRYKTGPFSRTWHRDGELIEEDGHVTDLITREAVAWVDGRRKDKPFFLYLPYTAPHIPIREPERWLALHKDVKEPSRREYAACVSHLDDGVGRVLAALDRGGHRENTLVVFTSDNGGYPTARNDDAQYPDGGTAYAPGPAGGNNRPLRGTKTQVYEGGIRVPAVARWPGRLKPGACDAPIHAADWMPTLCRLAGYTPPADLKWDGRDVWPVLAGEAKADARTLYWVGPGWRSAALRRGDMKLVVHRQPEKVELFDLAADPNEETDLAAKRPDVVAELKTLMAKVAERDNDAKPKDGK